MKLKVENFRKAYEKAVKEDKKEFKYKGFTFVTNYAKYLLIHIKENLNLTDTDYIELNASN